MNQDPAALPSHVASAPSCGAPSSIPRIRAAGVARVYLVTLILVSPNVDEDRDFEEVYRTWWREVYNAAQRVLGSPADAEDASQRVFGRLWKSGSWESIAQPRHFFRKAGRREALSMLRRPGCPTPLHSLNGPLVDAVRSLDPLPDEMLMRDDRVRLAAALITRLPPRCQTVCALVFLEGLTYPEVAARLGVTVKAVEKQVARGLQTLRRHVEEPAGPARPHFRTGGC